MTETTIEIKQVVTPYNNCVEQMFVHYRKNSKNLQGISSEKMSYAIEENIRLFLMVMDAFIEGDTNPKFPERKFPIQSSDDKPVISIWSGRYTGKSDPFMIQWDNNPNMVESARITAVMYNDTDPQELLNAMRGLVWGLDRYVEFEEIESSVDSINHNNDLPLSNNNEEEEGDDEVFEVDSHLALIDAEQGEVFGMSVGAIRISKDGKIFKLFGFNDLAEKEIVAMSDLNYIGLHVDKESESGLAITKVIGENYLEAGKSYRGKWHLIAKVAERQEKHLIIDVIELN